jgi:hypothetical protein
VTPAVGKGLIYKTWNLVTAFYFPQIAYWKIKFAKLLYVCPRKTIALNVLCCTGTVWCWNDYFIFPHVPESIVRNIDVTTWLRSSLRGPTFLVLRIHHSATIHKFHAVATRGLKGARIDWLQSTEKKKDRAIY